MRVLSLLLLCLSLLLGGPLHAGIDSLRMAPASPGSGADACLSAGSPHAHAAQPHHAAPQEASKAPCSHAHDTHAAHHASGHACCLPPVLASLPQPLAAEAAPRVLHARVPDLRLAERVDVPYRPPAA